MNNKEQNFISAVVYVHNAGTPIAAFLTGLHNTLNRHFEKFEIICVNDASSESDAMAIKEAARNMGSGILSIVTMSYYQGLEASMNAGLDLAIGDFVYEFDSSTMDYPEEMIPEVYHRMLHGFDIVSAGKKNRHLSSSIFYAIFNKNANFQYKLNTESFRILSRRAINRIHTMSKTIPYRKALYANCGLKTDILFYSEKYITKKGKIREHNKKRRDTAFNAFILFTDVAYKIAKIMTILMMTATLAGIVYTIAIYILKKPVPGYTTTMLVTSGAFFAVFFLLAIIIKYLSILVDLVFKEQNYLIESIEKVTK